MLYQSTGKIHYEPEKLIVLIEQELVDYYRSLIPWWHKAKAQKYPAHISVVRHETPVFAEFWGKYEGEEIEFSYDPDIKNSANYFWLNVFCVKLEEIRLELGLPVSSPYTRPPDGFCKCFHTTIGNCKEK